MAAHLNGLSIVSFSLLFGLGLPHADEYPYVRCSLRVDALSTTAFIAWFQLFRILSYFVPIFPSNLFIRLYASYLLMRGPKPNSNYGFGPSPRFWRPETWFLFLLMGEPLPSRWISTLMVNMIAIWVGYHFHYSSSFISGRIR